MAEAEILTGEAGSGPAVAMTEKTDIGSAELVEQLGQQALAGAAMAAAKPQIDSKSIRELRFGIVADSSRDALLTDFGKETLDDRYLLPNETYQDLFVRVADAYAAARGAACRFHAISIRSMTVWKA